MPDTVLAEKLVAHAPLDRTRPIAVPGRLLVSPVAARTRLILRGDPAGLGAAFGLTLPTQPCRAAVDGDRAALWLGPDEWLLMAPALDAAMPVSGGVVVDVSHRQAGVLVEGTAAADVLSAGCPLDLHTRAFPGGRCTRTVFGKAEIVLWRQDENRFHVEVWRSFAAYVHALLKAASSVT